MVRGENPPLALLDYGRRPLATGAGGVIREFTMRDKKTSIRRGLKNKAKAWLRRPATFRMASFVLNAISLIIRAIDFFE